MSTGVMYQDTAIPVQGEAMNKDAIISSPTMMLSQQTNNQTSSTLALLSEYQQLRTRTYTLGNSRTCFHILFISGNTRSVELPRDGPDNVQRSPIPVRDTISE